jgi:hypothetical protein
MKTTLKRFLTVATTVATASTIVAACGKTPAAEASQSLQANISQVDSVHGVRTSKAATTAATPVDATTPAAPVATPPTSKPDSNDTPAQTAKGVKDTTKASTKNKKTKATPKKPVPPEPAFSVTPRPDAILPNKRVVVYYGNPLSKRMGVLGEYPQNVMLAKLQKEVDAFNKADPSTPVQPGLHLIVTVAQGSPGKNNLYRLRMSDSLINYWCNLAASKGYLMFLDVQVGRSTVPTELQPLVPYLKRPYVHLALDPEFSMKQNIAPGKKIGTMDASDVNYAISLLTKLVDENNLPPKILVIHRFTQGMLTNYRKIHPVPEVQVVINMDGFGPPWLKRNSYNAYERMQPVQFTGFKLFYKNDKPMLSRKEVVDLDPSPVFITFQ